MKKLWIWLLVLFLNNASAQTSRTANADTTITYMAKTRGSSYECIVTKHHISSMSQSVSAVRMTKDLEAQEWETIMALLKPLQLEKMAALKAPSESSSTDRSRIASLKVTIGKKVYKSNSFDEGNPPTELEALINKILALSETIE